MIQPPAMQCLRGLADFHLHDVLVFYLLGEFKKGKAAFF